MADVVTTTRTDDWDGSSTVDVERFYFGFQGTDYEIDLTEKNAKKLVDAISLYIPKARVVEPDTRREPAPRAVRSAPATKRAPTGSGRSKEELALIRAWSLEQGYDVAKQGRIKSTYIDEWDALHKA